MNMIAPSRRPVGLFLLSALAKSAGAAALGESWRERQAAPAWVLAKAAQQLGPGERWITVHPPGHEKGAPVLIRENPDGSAHIIGGIGGAMTGLRLTGRKKGQSEAEATLERQKDRRAAKEAKVAEDKASGVHEAKQAARKDVKEQQTKAERDFIDAVAKVKGWDPASLEFDESKFADASPAALKALAQKHHKAVLKAAHGAAREAGDSILLDHETRAKDIGEIPVESSSAETISVADLDPVKPPGSGLGFSPNYGKRAAAAGFSPEEAQKIADKATEAKLATMTPEERSAALERGQAKQILDQELKGLRDAPLFDPKGSEKQASMVEALSILTARKKLQQASRAAAAAHKEIDDAKEAPRAFSIVTEDGAALSDAVRKDIAQGLQTVAARTFLTAAGEYARPELDRHIGVGAYNAMNSLALTVAGAGLMDRSVVDVLGVGAAAQALVSRLRASLSPKEFEDVREAMEDFHTSTYAATTGDAVKQAKKWAEIAKSVEVPETVVSGEDLQLAQDMNEKRRHAIGEARRALGTILGETEANAAMVAALRAPSSAPAQINMGAGDESSVATRMAAIGLLPDDYEMKNVGGSIVVSIPPEILGHLTDPMSRDDISQLKRSQEIMRGGDDEEGWLPLGFASRPDLGTSAPMGVAPRLAKPFAPKPGGDLTEALKDYIGGRMADGDAPSDIIGDAQSLGFFEKAGDNAAYAAALQDAIPLKGKDGKFQHADALAPLFDQYADSFVQKAYGGTRSPLSSQKIPTSDVTVDALHRALSATPEGVSAYKPIGDLTPQDQRALRTFFGKNIAKESPQEAELREALEDIREAEPEKTAVDLFGGTETNPAWLAWRTKRDAAAAAYNAAGLSWGKYLGMMGGTTKAYEAVQDLIRSRISEGFARNYNTLSPKEPIKIGRAAIRNSLTHLEALDPAARDAKVKMQAEIAASLRDRIAGKFASGTIEEKLAAQKQAQKAVEQSQLGLFSFDEPEKEAPAVPDDLGLDERHTIGHAAESQLAALMPMVGANFKAGQPVKLWNASMSGKYAPQQRAIKMLLANKRLGGALGAGSGKTAIMLGSFSHLHSKGEIKRAIMAVPSVVQGQFAGEALRYLQPGKYKWHAEPGAPREERIAAYKDPANHFMVVTHQSLRDDMVHLGAKHAGISEDEMGASIKKMSRGQRAAWMKETMAKEGIDFGATFVDEAHETVDRAGKEDSSLSTVMTSMSDNTPYYGYFSGDPVKNDASEVHSVLSKLDGARYGDRDAFMRRYGADTMSSKDALRREMSRYVFANKISSGAVATHHDVEVDLTPGQKTALADLDKHFAAAKLARRKGEVATDSMKVISPGSFEGVPADQHEAIAGNLQKSLGIMRSSAERRIIDSHPDNAKMDQIEKEVAARPGKQGVVFAHARSDVEAIRKRLEAMGKRVVTITGSDTAADKDKKRKMFNPEQGDPEADIVVASDAGAVGMNLQSGHYLIQHDVPQTAKTHGQRNARIDRLGQKNAIDLISLSAKHRSERRARDRLAKKYDLRELMTSPMDGLDDTGFAHFLAMRQNAAQQKGLF